MAALMVDRFNEKKKKEQEKKKILEKVQLVNNHNRNLGTGVLRIKLER